jgi:quercetin dioxygenase-like cupin family protein
MNRVALEGICFAGHVGHRAMSEMCQHQTDAMQNRRRRSLLLRRSRTIVIRTAFLSEATTIQRSIRKGYPMAEGIDGPVSAQQAGFAGVTRKVLERLPLPGDNRELVVVEVTYPPGGVAPLHRHPVGGAIYIVEGVAESAYGSDDPRQYRTGETLQDRADIPHTLFRNCDSERPLRFLTIYVLEPGRSYTMEP